MGSACETAQETVDLPECARGKYWRGEGADVSALRRAAFMAALPATVTIVTVLDRTKEPGGLGEPLYLDVVTALMRDWPMDGPLPRLMPRVWAGGTDFLEGIHAGDGQGGVR
jgi:pyruvate-ferredoxin/flavodoxin oxidoreductase